MSRRLQLFLVVFGVFLVLPWQDLLAQARMRPRRLRRSSWYEPQSRPRGYWEESRRGLYLGVGGQAVFVTESSNELSELLDTGGGGIFFLGYRINDYFALEGSLSASYHGADGTYVDYAGGALHGLALDGKVFLVPRSKRLEPFLQMGFGGYMFYEDSYRSSELAGMGFHLGGGADLRVARHLSLGLRALYKGLNLRNDTEWYVNRTDVFMSLFALEANVQFRF